MKKKSEKIIFDTRWIGEHGIGRFAKEVYDKEIFQPITLKGNPVSIFDVLKLTLYLLLHRDFFYSPGFNAPLFFLNRTAITLHDLNHIDLDANSSVLKRLYYNLILKRACRKCAFIVTVSEFSKKRIVEWSGVNPNKVKVIYNGVSEAFHPNVKAYEPGFPYIFIVGNRKLHKNEDRAMRAFAQANIDKNIRLLFSGKPSDQLLQTSKELNIENRIIFLGQLSEKQLASTYKGAICLLFPSLYEGFGLPVIEANACETPVITSNIGALQEITEKEFNILINPESILEIKEAIESFTNKTSVQKNKSIKIHLEKFNWEISKKQLKNYFNFNSV
ncbi:glycosyltransferase family 1 protein [Acinetobacter sp. SWAC5]|uniref:glycosyltransferase family 4 protein n=1 Tax=Acinetobacter sp. SWAC5 TaxID=2293835 RepID=UPI000E348D01|nr:glycosyltransferase family 1 protein [Acinetobacter sp. SWAC5]RFS29457.1 glycosyltransferase family 1 protein [Acinetobacter sp. SWAC5]